VITGSPRKPLQKKSQKPHKRFTVSYEPSLRIRTHLEDTKERTGATFKWQLEQAMIARVEATA
jgi:hypothetical protein